MSAEQPILTIAIPTYNRDSWLDKALAIIVQEVKQLAGLVEVVISNNASTDTTEAIVDKYRDTIGFKFFRQIENIGAIRNINFIVNEAQGKYVWVLGDDDFLFAGFLNKLIELIVQSDTEASLIYVENVVWAPATENEQNDIMDIDAYSRIDYNKKELVFENYSHAYMIADPSRAYFNALCKIILLKGDYQNAFKIGANAGPEFTSIESTFPHSYYIAKNLLNMPCIGIKSPGTYSSYAVSWKRFREITYLKWYPELYMLMAEFGGNREKSIHGRRELFSNYDYMLPMMLLRRAANYKYFSFNTFVKNNIRFPEFWVLPYRILKRGIVHFIKRATFSVK